MTEPTITYAQPQWGLVAKVSAAAGPTVTPDFARRLDQMLWRGHSGGGKGGTIRREYDGGRTTPDVVPSRRPELTTITLTALFKPARDMPLIRGLLLGSMSMRGTIWVQPKDAQMNNYGDPLQYLGCLLTNVNPPDGDAQGEAGATWTCTWEPADVAVFDAAGR